MSDSNKNMLINVEDDETRIAIANNQMLDNLYIDYTHRAQTVGNIYIGIVVKIQSSFQAAFVDYGAERHGFLAASDLNQMLFKAPRGIRGRPAINQLLHPGQKIMVQVAKDEIAHKGAALTTNISLPGRFLVFMPNSDKGGVSKRIEDNETRNRLKHLLKGLGSEDASAIIRTAGVDRSLSELKQDFMTLRRTWNQIKQSFEGSSKPKLLHQEEDAVVRMLRDYFTDDVGDVIIDDPEAFQRALEFFQTNMPGRQKKLQLYLGERPIFSEHRIEDQIEWLNHPQVPLPSGGSLVIQPTEALVSIDVNSGKSNQEKNIEETALRTNIEAAEEVARQLRLRNLGGLIVIDFIDMNHSQNRQAVVQCLSESLSKDKAKWTLGEISQFGLLEMSRQRIASSLSQSGKELCPACHGSGKVISNSSLANKLLRQMRDLVLNGKIQEVRLRLPLVLAEQLLNQKRKHLYQLEMEYSLRIKITPDPSLTPGEIPDIELVGRDGGLVQESVDSDPREAYRNRDFRARARRDFRIHKEPHPSKEQIEEPEDSLLEEVATTLESVTENNSANEEGDDESKQQKSRSRNRGRGRGRGRGRRDFSDESSDDQLDQHDGNFAEEIENDAPTNELEESPPKPKRSAGWTIYSSVHEKNGKEDDSPWQPLPISPWRRKLRTLPPHTIVFSSTHIDAQGNLLNQPAATETLGNALSVEVPELGLQDLTSTEHSTVDNSAQESSETTKPFEDSTLSKENESTVQDQSSAQTDSEETKILEPSSEHKVVLLSEENFISDELTLSEDSSVTDAESITVKAPESSGTENVEVKNPTEETNSEELKSSEPPEKEEERNLEDSSKTESTDPSEKTPEVNLEEQSDSLAPVVEMPKSAKRGTRKTSPKTTRPRKKQSAKIEKNYEEQPSSGSAAEVTEINSSQKGSVNVSDDQVESQPDEKTAASKVG
ncbi:MAG: Rne/Rng family ribonuclease [Deltaproteobacteria bacterium]